MVLLERYAWPGNVRELENEMERAVVLGGEQEKISPNLLSPHIAGVSGLAAPPKRQHSAPDDAMASLVDDFFVSEMPVDQAVEGFEAEILRRALSRFGSQSAAARALGIPRTTLRNRLRKLEIESEPA